MLCERPPAAFGGSPPHEGENLISPSVRGSASEASEGVAHTPSQLELGNTLSLQQLALHPLQFFTDIVNDVAGLQAVGQDVPRVRFDLKLPGDGIRFVKF
jgi:hypothetical protein